MTEHSPSFFGNPVLVQWSPSITDQTSMRFLVCDSRNTYPWTLAQSSSTCL